MIHIEKLSKGYGDKQLFDAFNLQINKNDKILISAPSGSGKTTLIRMLMGFEDLDEGIITIDHLTLNKGNIKAIRERIAYVSQDADLEDITVKELLATIFNYKINKHINNYEQLFFDLCQYFKLDASIYQENIRRLSGGERQRVALIIALILHRPIIILDEITSGLDLDLKELIVDYVSNAQHTFIIISHDVVWHHRDSIKVVTLS